MLEIKDVSVDMDGKKLVEDISFSLECGHWLMIAGPNGAGKSTIVKAISQGYPYSGRVLIDGEDAAKMKSADFARKLGVLSQSHEVTYSFTVREVVALGRYPYSKSIFSSESEDDKEKIDAAIRATGLDELSDRSVLTLSGGELQRTFLAQLFAQDPRVIVLDEPTNNLDLVYQKQVFELIRQWLEQGDRAVISIVHDLSLARLYGTDALLLDRGRIVAAGEPEDVISGKNLSSVYSMDVAGYMRTLLSVWEPVKSAEIV